MDDRISKFLSDILKCINEIDAATERYGRQYDVFETDYVFRKFVERNIEIVGEAVGRILKLNPSIEITSARKIVDTRNYVIHAYDSLKPDILWAIVINHIPVLKSDVMQLLKDHDKNVNN